MIKVLLRNLFSKQFLNLSIYGFGQAFNLVTPLLVIPFIVGVCGEENFGKSAIGMAICFFLMVFIDYGSDLVGVREISVNRNNRPQLQHIFITTYFSKLLLLLVVLSVVVILFLTVPFFTAEKPLFLFGLSVLIGQFLNPTWFLQGMENVKWITVSNIISKVLYIVFIFLFIKSKSDYIYINFFWGIGMIIANAIFLGLIIKTYQFSFAKCSFTEVKALLSRDFKIFTSQIFVSIQMYAPVVLIGWFGSNLMAGQYKIVEQVILIFKTYILLFFNFVFPKICYLIENNPRKAILTWKIYNGANFVFISLSMFCVYFLSNEVVYYFSDENQGLLSSLLQIAVFYPILLAVSIPLKQLVLGWNHKRFYVNITTVLVLVNVIAIILLLPKFKTYGVFYSLIFTEVIVIIFYLICVRKNWLQKTAND